MPGSLESRGADPNFLKICGSVHVSLSTMLCKPVREPIQSSRGEAPCNRTDGETQERLPAVRDYRGGDFNEQSVRASEQVRASTSTNVWGQSQIRMLC